MKNSLQNAKKIASAHFATDMMLLEDPLEYLSEDHFRAKTVCETIRRVVKSDAPGKTDLVEILSFLRSELPLLLHDEDDDLCELLRTRVLPEDGFEHLSQKVVELHKSIDLKRLQLIEAVENLVAGKEDMAPQFLIMLSELEREVREDMIMENAKLMPLARARLTPDDIAKLRSLMLRRHIADLDRA